MLGPIADQLRRHGASHNSALPLGPELWILELAGALLC